MVSRLPLDGKRLQKSQIWQICKEHPFVTRGVINLWLAANDASPPGKLVDDDFALAHQADVLVPDFREHRSLYLHGFVSDGRGHLLHPVIIEMAGKKSKKSSRKIEPYSDTFDAIWKAYRVSDHCPGASKLLAWEGFASIRQPKPSDQQMLGFILGYLAECERRKNPVCHPATYFNQRRWEGQSSTPAYDPIVDAERAMKAWGGLARPLVEEIGVAPFMAFFKDSSVRKGPPFTIRVKKDVVKRLIEKKFSSQISAKFGRFLVEVAA